MLYFLWLSIYIQERVKQLTQVNRSVYYTKKVIGHRCNNSPSPISITATGYHSDQRGVAKVYFRSSAKGGTHAEAVGERKRYATMPQPLAIYIIYIYIYIYLFILWHLRRRCEQLPTQRVVIIPHIPIIIIIISIQLIILYYINISTNNNSITV